MLELRTLAAIISSDTVVLVVMLLLVGVYAWTEKRKAAAYRQMMQSMTPTVTEVEPVVSVPEVEKEEAKGTAGTILLHDVPDREAAMVMAVVAHRLGKPLNQLRFKSIREVKDK